MNVTQLLNNNCFHGRNGYKPKYIILHGTAGGTSAQAIATYFKNTQSTANPVSAHYVIGQAGEIYQCNLESDGAWAQGIVTAGHDAWWSETNTPNPNNICIAIEHCKPDDANATQLTSAQQSSSFALVADICKRNNIPMRAADASGGVTGHYSVDPVNRARCPGVYSWDALWTYLNGGNTMTIPQGWTDDGTTLTAPNGIRVVLGFRDHVLNSNWNAANWPLEPEQHLAIVEQSNPSVGPGQAQTFRWTRLEYTPALGVVEGWLGQELLWYEKYAAQLQAEITAANLLKINTLASQIVKLSQVQ